MTDSLLFESGDRSNELVKPPFFAVVTTAVLALVSALFLLGSSNIGYGVSVAASIAGGLTSLLDQKRRGNSNYSSYDSFRYSLMIVRYGVLVIAVLHIIRMAINAANGGGMFG